MSFCRWGIHGSDVYCFEDVRGGFTTMCTDGREFNDPGLQSFRSRLLALRDEGLTVPEFAVDTVDDLIRAATEADVSLKRVFPRHGVHGPH